MRLRAGIRVLALAALFAATSAFADCGEFLLGSSPLSRQIFDQAVREGHPPLTAAGILPEEVLAYYAHLAPEADLFGMIHDDLGIRRTRFGSKTAVKGGALRARTLVLERPRRMDGREQARQALALARALFSEKVRQSRWRMRPRAYVDGISAYALALEKFVYPALGALDPASLPEARKGFGYVGYGLRAFFGFVPGSARLWPLSQDGGSDYLLNESANPEVRRRAGFHWTLTRAFFAAYMAVASMALSHVPEAVKTATLLFALRAEIGEVVRQMGDGLEYDPRGERIKIISAYQEKIARLEADLAGSDDPAAVRSRIESLNRAIRELRLELESPG